MSTASQEGNTESKKERVNVWELTWLDVEQLKKYTTESGRILPRRITRLSAMEQRYVTKLIKRARNMLALL